MGHRLYDWMLRIIVLHSFSCNIHSGLTPMLFSKRHTYQQCCLTITVQCCTMNIIPIGSAGWFSQCTRGQQPNSPCCHFSIYSSPTATLHSTSKHTDRPVQQIPHNCFM